MTRPSDNTVRSIFGRFSSVRGNLTLVIMLTTAAALLTTGIALLRHDLTVYRQSLASDLGTEAQILALSTAPALAFDDQKRAERNLAALRAKPAVLIAAVYAANGSLYASFVREGAAAPAQQLQSVSTLAMVANGKMAVSRDIDQNGEFLGTIYLVAAYDFWAHVNAYLKILGLIMLMSMAVALALSSALRRSITGPVENLAEVAREIVTRRDLTLRAPQTALEEFSIVVKAFNSVLDECEQRTQDLLGSNQALTQQVHERRTAESALALANARLESTMAAAEIGSWVWNLKSGEVTLDRNLAALYGRDAGAPLNGDATLLHQQIFAEDLSRVLAAEEASMHTGRLESTEYRLVLPNGSLRWVVSRGTVHRDAAQQPTLLLGLLIDITAQRVVERALRASEKLYRAIGESIDYGVWVCDANGRNVYASDSFLRLAGLSQAQCSDLGWRDVLHPDDVQATITAWQECVRTGDVWYREHRVRGTDGNFHPILAQGVQMRDEDGKPSGWAGINLDISRIKKTEQALREADRRKDEFLATLAHELRNPLAPIRHAARLLGVKNLDEVQSRSAREIIARQVTRMALLLDDLLELSRITRGRVELRKEPVALKALVSAALETAQPSIDSKHHTLEVNMPSDSPELLVDPLRMSQALSNLLTNAAKYTDAGGRIVLDIQRSDKEVTFAVTDSGIGLHADVIPAIFEMFSQVDSAIDRSEGGLGIGLALVKGLVALHGGSVEASSAGAGKGSTFTIRLPAELIHATPVPRALPNFAHTTTGPYGKVLVVDDNRDAANSLAMVLGSCGHTTFTAYSGEQALHIGQQERPDAVVLDIGMPDMNGYETAQRIRQTDWGKTALLLAVTGWGQKEDVERAVDAGFTHHMTKPADPERVERLVRDFLAQQHSSPTSGRTHHG
jgi:PAS domain S-box-containing protein